MGRASRHPIRAVAPVALGAVVGTGLAALTVAVNDPCLASALTLAEGAESGARVRLWPPGVICAYTLPEGGRRSAEHGPGLAATLVWMAAGIAVAAAALYRRGGAGVRGVAGATVTLALLGFVFQVGEFVLATACAVVIGIPAAAAVERASRPRAPVEAPPSLLVGRLVAPATVVAWAPVYLLGTDALAIVAGAAAGGLVATLACRWRPGRWVER